MKIEDKNATGHCLFKELADGEVFEHEGDVYMKVEEATGGIVDYNAVDLETGQLAELAPNDHVKRREATLVLS